MLEARVEQLSKLVRSGRGGTAVFQASKAWLRRRAAAARPCNRGDVYAEHRLPVAIHAEGSAAQEHGSRLPDPLELGWDDREDPRCAVCAMSRGDRPGGQPDSLRDRLPEREKRGKRGSALIRPAMMRARRSRGSSGISRSIR
jgi:hypothetical protein